MGEWMPIETAPQNGKRIEVFRGSESAKGAYWFEGDLTAGWANHFGKPLSFEPTHWAHLLPADEE